MMWGTELQADTIAETPTLLNAKARDLFVSAISTNVFRSSNDTKR